ncbi:related to Molybdopterin synthase sulfur carrier subunit [Cephalotrichum gorgonifer]|uniref:Molybdopterin synthase sulfur carrier subunit n=1 Tax=Cephalotrichum gorgonifer TaxID=2041049 RepID=A0AAE8MQ93_9PEZI|nr:related to Molybdopterin synthase sulfur carrier subunit [Cephalotrichum gorgonifer]
MSSGRPPPGHFTVLYFAAVSTHTARDSESLPAPLPLKSLFAALEERYPGIGEKLLRSCLVTVNLEYVDITAEEEGSGAGVVIQEGDEVALIPPACEVGQGVAIASISDRPGERAEEARRGEGERG